MGFLSLFLVATMPVVQVLLIGVLGAYLASGYSNILNPSAREHMNKVVFAVFTPTLMFSSLSQTVTLKDIISWWFMPINVGLIFLIGSILGHIVVKILRIERHLHGLVVAACSAGNLGNLLLIIIPAICNENAGLFGEPSICRANGLSYVSLSMALGGLYMWTYTYSLMKKASNSYDQLKSMTDDISRLDACEANRIEEDRHLPPSILTETASEHQIEIPLMASVRLSSTHQSFSNKLRETLDQIFEEVLAPPTFSAITGFLFGVTPWLKSLVIGEDAPLRVIQDSIKILGNGTIPCITLLLGGNLAGGLRKSSLKPLSIVAVILVRYMILPVIGIGVVKLAGELGYLAQDPLYHFLLMIQFTLPPAMNISTMSQLLHSGQEESSVVLLWSYLVATLALTAWSMVFMWILS